MTDFTGLTLAEKKLILNTDIKGADLFEISLKELIVRNMIKVRVNKINSNNHSLKHDSIQYIEKGTNYNEASDIRPFNPFIDYLLYFNNKSLRNFVKGVAGYFNKDFEKYKNDFVIKN